ncbi:MAG: hypothetical protein KAJ14_16190 [Candidatus Omnitrophica bacterium]|nr:hypothetical protein [Candidatus Omnitrophota bacterium]MCK5494651.1 hypothetical protein [Candidatus Omnitrophota bacterium]
MEKSGEKSKIEKIKKQNAQFEKKSPYNFCDRWCERCQPEVRNGCKVYQDEFDRNLILISNGKDPYNMDFFIEEQYTSIDKTLELMQDLVEDEYGFSDEDNKNIGSQKERKQFLENPFYKLVVQYSREAHDFLKDAFYNKDEVESELVDDYETISWYHTLLPSKVHRLLCDANIKDENDSTRYADAFAQIAIINKSIGNSEKALQDILRVKISYNYVIFDLLELLSQIANQVKLIEDLLVSEIK